MAITPIVAAIGVASSAIGTATSIFGAAEKNQAQKQELAIQGQEQAQRKKLFEIEQQRKRVEDLRNAQQAQAVARTHATAQGAQFGSGLLGGMSQIQGASNYNILGIEENTMIGENLFSLDQRLTEAKTKEANATTMMGIGGSMTSFGGAMINSMGTIGNLTSGRGVPQFDNPTKLGQLY